MTSPLEARRARLITATTPLPGSVPRNHYRPLNVPGRFDRFTLLDFLDAFHPHYGREHWKALCEAGQIHCKQKPVSAERLIRAGERFDQLLIDCVEPAVNPAIELVSEDESLIVVRKPAPLPMHPCGRFARNSLSSILAEVYDPTVPILTHRLDANTSGLVLFGLNRDVAKQLHTQFEERRVKKRYLARIHGRPEKPSFQSETRISENPCEAGARLPDPNGLEAFTEFQLLESFPDGTSLVEARPITGRTNQIRLHLWDQGLPIVGDPVYLPDRRMGRTQTLSVEDPPMCLHAVSIQFMHPSSGEMIFFEDRPPDWAR